jgi:hypothetical protein
MSEHPMQPVERAPDGVIRFKGNAVVRFLVDWARDRGMSLNELAAMDFPAADFEQLAQLIGYSVSGFGDLSYASPEAVAKADALAKPLAVREDSGNG